MITQRIAYVFIIRINCVFFFFFKFTIIRDACNRRYIIHVYRVLIERKQLDTIACFQLSDDGVFITKQGKINFVDLAGSEMTKKTMSEGKTLEEANNINKSLMVLGKYIQLYCIYSVNIIIINTITNAQKQYPARLTRFEIRNITLALDEFNFE